MHLVIEEEKALLKMLTGIELNEKELGYIGMVARTMYNRKELRDNMDQQSIASNKMLPRQ